MLRTKTRTNSVSNQKLIDDYLKANGNITYCEAGAETEDIVYITGSRRKKPEAENKVK
jgi:hypothetical protein|tara:strand:- start:145 stop:318 length:174 start_codon:yes stop_codon:yes gene_type:complete